MTARDVALYILAAIGFLNVLGMVTFAALIWHAERHRRPRGWDGRPLHVVDESRRWR
jgi:hypothetical protein